VLTCMPLSCRSISSGSHTRAWYWDSVLVVAVIHKHGVVTVYTSSGSRTQAWCWDSVLVVAVIHKHGVETVC